MRRAIGGALLALAKRISPDTVREDYDRRAGCMVMSMAMHFLDSQKVEHCWTCAQTHGLTIIDGRACCPRHKTEV